MSDPRYLGLAQVKKVEARFYPDDCYDEMGLLIPDKAEAWSSERQRQLPEETAPAPIPEMVDVVARAIYGAHWRAPSPTWEAAAEHSKEWARKQAREAMSAIGNRLMIDAALAD